MQSKIWKSKNNYLSYILPWNSVMKNILRSSVCFLIRMPRCTWCDCGCYHVVWKERIVCFLDSTELQFFMPSRYFNSMNLPKLTELLKIAYVLNFTNYVFLFENHRRYSLCWIKLLLTTVLSDGSGCCYLYKFAKVDSHNRSRQGSLPGKIYREVSWSKNAFQTVFKA